ncbi:MAG: GLPGLI family protein [Lewinellaceae bacterium]|nr:GLPGLI family protein [Lewinellaceae bacterium]
MKKLLLFCALTLPLLALAQPAGKIIYQEKVNLHRDLGPDQEDYKAMIPEWQTSKAVLLYDGQASLYKAVEEDESEINREEGGAQVNIRIRRNSDVLYRNYPEHKQVEVRDFMGKKFLVETETEGREWKITPEQKSINGDVCQRASFTNSEGVEVVAWFAPSIPAPVGPGEFYGLPGAILMVDVDNGRRLYEAVQVELQGEAPEIEAPTEGKKIDKAEYDQMVEERMREMGGSGRHGIRIIRQ